MQVTIPENIKDITLEQFQKYDALNKRENISDLEYNKRCISIFTNLPYRDIANIKQTDYEVLLLNIAKALQTPCDFENIFKLHGVEYGFIPNLDKITQGEWVDMGEYQTDVKDNHKLMSILFREVTKKDVMGNYSIKAYDGTKERGEVFKDMPMNIVNGALGFFLTLSHQLEKAIQRSTIAELAKVQRHPITLRNGDGMPA